MNTAFQINYRHNKANLHVRVAGTFDGSSAHELLHILQSEYRGGKVFVDTAALGEVLPFGRSVLQARLCQTAVPASELFFKGEKGFAVAPSGSRVLIVSHPKKSKEGEQAEKPKKKGCCGNCAHCTCRERHDH